MQEIMYALRSESSLRKMKPACNHKEKKTKAVQIVLNL